MKDNMNYSLCNKVQDSHDYLFFSCDFSSKVWNMCRNLVRLNNAPSNWSDIVVFMLKRPLNKSIWSIMQSLVIGAAVYFVWQERNLRTFQDVTRNVDVICQLIKDTVRVRVMGLNLNDFDQVLECA